jgi:hypothetical protein
MTTLVSRVACMRLLDCVIFSARSIHRGVCNDSRPSPCLSLQAPTEAKPSMSAGGASSTRPRHPPRLRFHSTVISNRSSNLTPRITRPPTPEPEHDIPRVAGRVHALVRWRPSLARLPPRRASEMTCLPAPCLPLPAGGDARPSITASGAFIKPLRHPLRPHIHSAEIFRPLQQSNAAHHAPARILPEARHHSCRGSRACAC